MSNHALLALAVVIPLFSFVILALFGARLGKPKASWVALAAIGISCLLATTVLLDWVHADVDGRAAITQAAHDASFHWATFGTIPIDVYVKLDALTVIMFFMVTFIAFWIHYFSIGYMAGHSDEVDGESKYHRFFAYLSLFCFSMLGLVVAGSLLFMFMFWELVGLCSYLLIGFYFDKKFASNAAMKAFITNRVGDFGFLIGMMLVVLNLHTFDLDEAARVFAHQHAAGTGIFASSFTLFGFGLASLMGIGLFCGAMGKSAQFPLHVWLPDAMAGPTPVSALIHAATMVAAGVYLVARVFRLLTPDAQMFIAMIGCITLTITALIAIVQTDIKKVLAYSTLSQLGYMIFGMGVGAWVAALFHLMTHAFFKAMLFLGSGQVIEGCHHEQDIRKMGGLRRKMPVTCWTFFVGVLAIAGFGIPWTHWGLGGFFSKDEILAVAYERTFNWHREMGAPHVGEEPEEAAANEELRMQDGEAAKPAQLIATAAGPDSKLSILQSSFEEEAQHGAGEHPLRGPTTGPTQPEAAHHAGSPEMLAIASTVPVLPKWMFYLPIIIAYVTPFYMMRCWWLTFAGKPRDPHVYDHAHESPTMFVPLVVLAAGTLFCSYWLFRPLIHEAGVRAADASAIIAVDGLAHSPEDAGRTMLTLTHSEGHDPHKALGGIVGFAWIIGMGLAALIYAGGLATGERIRRFAPFRLAHKALSEKLYFDHIYDNLLVGGTVMFAFVCKFIDKVFVDGLYNGAAFVTRVVAFFTGRQLDMPVRKGDFGLVDGIVNTLARVTWQLGWSLRRPQNGRIRTYIVLATGAVASALLIILFSDQIGSGLSRLLRVVGMQSAVAAG